jgi:hypothetical protein
VTSSIAITRAPRKTLHVGPLLVAALAAACVGNAPRNEALGDFTGTHTRVVWVQGDGTDPGAQGTNLRLMGFDSRDGRGERPILADKRNYMKPLLTPTGDRILYSTNPTASPPKVFVVDWNGGGPTHLADGFALTVWENPLDGSAWVYVGRDNEEFNFRRVVRFPLDNPGAEELVWDKTMVSNDTFQVSSDGRVAAGLFPWPLAALGGGPNRETP